MDNIVPIGINVLHLKIKRVYTEKKIVKISQEAKYNVF